MKKFYSLAAVCAGVVFGVTAAPSSLVAQAEGQSAIQMVATQPTSVSVPAEATASPVGPIAETAAFHSPAPATRVMMDQDTGPSLGSGLAMTAVGVVMVGVGAAVGGGSGTAIAIGGAALALYGIYHWLK